MVTAQEEATGTAGLRDGDGAPSVAERILLTLEACAAGNRSLTLAQLVDETGLAKTTLHRTCWKLVDLGLLEHGEDGFSIGLKMFALGNANPLLNQLRVAAMPILLELQRSTGGMSNLAILHDGKALIIDALYAPQPAIPRLVGASLPLHSTAVGKAIAATFAGDRLDELFAERPLLPAVTWRTIIQPTRLREHLAQVADKGIATSDEEFMMGVCGVAAAVRVRSDQTVAIGYVGPCNLRAIGRASEPVREAAIELQEALA